MHAPMHAYTYMCVDVDNLELEKRGINKLMGPPWKSPCLHIYAHGFLELFEKVVSKALST
jgi:hypothetical protein